MNDTILVRLDISKISDMLSKRDLDSESGKEKILEKMIDRFQMKIEDESREFENGHGLFEICLFEAQ
ncbi:MAG: hypothetical protein KAR07_04845 [Spirochaetes bacterium]|nr:hypothetical protein [Spirochaetota bacterium]